MRGRRAEQKQLGGLEDCVWWLGAFWGNSWEGATSRAISDLYLGASWNGPKLSQGEKIEQNSNSGPVLRLSPWLSHLAAQTHPVTEVLTQATESYHQWFLRTV